MQQKIIRPLCRGAYDVQKLRIETGNRIVGHFKSKYLGQAAGKKEEELEREARFILDDLRGRYKLLAEAVAKTKKPEQFTGDEIISTFTEACLVSNYVDLEKAEESHFRRLEQTLPQFPIWTEFLEGVRGCGRAMAAVIISEIDIAKARYVSSLWKYSGLDVAEDGAGRSRKKEHLVKREYVNKKGEAAERDSITFNPFLKTKLTGVLGPCFLKANSSYREYYDNYKHRISTDPAHSEKSKAWIHNMSIRYMIKMFEADLWRRWREIEGLPITPTYHETKHGHVHASIA